MIGLGELAVIVGLNLVGAASPGPDAVLVMRTATRSRRHAWAVVAGIQVGVLFWCSFTVLGAATLLQIFPWLLSALQTVGGLVLVAMGAASAAQGWRERNNPPADLAEARSRLGSLRAAFTRGLSTNLSNPKIVFALTAMIAPLLPPNPGPGTAVVVILALWLTSIPVFLFYAQVVSIPRLQCRLLAAGPYIDLGAGSFFIIVGTVLFLHGISVVLG